jgi:hypothetical protein
MKATSLLKKLSVVVPDGDPSPNERRSGARPFAIGGIQARNVVKSEPQFYYPAKWPASHSRIFGELAPSKFDDHESSQHFIMPSSI